MVTVQTDKRVPPQARPWLPELGAMGGLLSLVLLILFGKIIYPDIIVFSNDGPIGLIRAFSDHAFGLFHGFWYDLNWLGSPLPGATANLTQISYFLTAYNPVIFTKIYPEMGLFLLGLAAWFFFRQLKFHPAVCVLAGLATALNMNFFSNACWGLPTRAFSMAGVFFALGLLQRLEGRWTDWLRAALAGLGVGLGIMEGYDVGALLSLFVAVFAVFMALLKLDGVPMRRLVTGVGHTVVVTAFAALISAQALSILIETQIKGVVEMETVPRDSLKKWIWTTQWSLPKAETLRVLIPGLFGYRMDTLGGGNYWGAVGRTPGWEENRQGVSSFSGSGEYAGVLVVMIALWAVAQSFGKQTAPFPPERRRIIWFWSLVGLVSLLFAFGRHAPFYHLIYPLPFFNTMRNPIKFMHPFHLSLIVLFGYGLEDLCRRYVQGKAPRPGSVTAQIKAWWPSAPSRDKFWCLGLGAWLGLSVIAWLMVAASPNALIQYIQSQGVEPNLAELISHFCRREIGLYVLFLVLSAALMVLVLSRAATGARARWLWLALGLVLVLDLGRANLPWIQYWNYKSKYENNAVIDFLRKQAGQQRTVIFPFQLDEAMGLLQQVYGIEWSQHHFLFYRIPSLDVIQEPRESIDNAEFRKVFPRELKEPMDIAEFIRLRVRLWELTSTRFVLGLSGGFVDGINQQFDPARKRLRSVLTFALGFKNDHPTKLEDYTATASADGPYAVVEFTGALPVAQLYSRWQVMTNHPDLLRQLAKPEFDPAQIVLVGQELPVPAAARGSPANAGTVETLHYEPKYIQLSAQVTQPSVLLYNAKFDPNWRVWVDGQPESLFRANYLMRGVFLKPGNHVVEYRFQPPHDWLYVSLAGWGFGLMLILALWWIDARPLSNHREIKS